MPELTLLDRVVFDVVKESEEKIEEFLDCEVMYYKGEIGLQTFQYFRNFIEIMAGRDSRRSGLAICLTTPGGSAEIVEKMVEVIRHHFDRVYFLVPEMAMSAGTILCMSGDRIYMDYSSSLGPIDPQVLNNDGTRFIPALGYLDKVSELVEKSRSGTLTPAEFALLDKLDLAMLRFYEQARDLSRTLLKRWLVEYKFRNWSKHRTTNPGTDVTLEEKEARAEEIAKLLCDNNAWRSHSRMIGMKTLRNVARLEIDDFGEQTELHEAVRRYSDTLSDYLARQGIPFFLYNRRTA